MIRRVVRIWLQVSVFAIGPLALCLLFNTRVCILYVHVCIFVHELQPSQAPFIAEHVRQILSLLGRLAFQYQE